MKNPTGTPENYNNDNNKSSYKKHGHRGGLEKFPWGWLGQRAEGWWEILIVINKK